MVTVKELDLDAVKRVLKDVSEREALEKPRGGMISPPEFVLARKIEELEARIEKLENMLIV